ncbi:MAG: glycosyltransferase family 2 protein [Fibrobacteria bacterium]|nr:glycosyltransferase family 2 protein [Fibrobacteria bacterium]
MGDSVVVVLLNWKGFEDTVACVESCLKLDHPETTLLIVDNASPDGSGDRLHQRFPDLPYLQTGANLGFAGGNNAGIREAARMGATYAWVLNNDTEVDPGSLSALVRCARSDDRIGLVGSRIFYHSKPDVLWFAGGSYDRRTGRSFHEGEGQVDAPRYRIRKDVQYVTGCSMLFPLRLIPEVGLMDERFFLIGEELDWNRTIAGKGYRIVYEPESVLWHKVSASFASSPLSSWYYNTRNALLFVSRHHPAWLPFALQKSVRDWIYHFRKGKREHREIYMGIRDFLLGRFGRRPD